MRIKVVIGFIPAFLTFALTKDWWFLAYGGAFIWFGITGLRNILQSVLGGGGFRRSPLLRWNDYVSWSRLTDSLLFTGFSVPLLDYIVKTVILDRMFGITTATNPSAPICRHGLGQWPLPVQSQRLPRSPAAGRSSGILFRSILSIPLAIAFNAIDRWHPVGSGLRGHQRYLQKWAAIISKAASDCVAGIIEGFADRYENIHVRTIDYKSKLRQLFDTYARLELLFPETDVFRNVGIPQKIHPDHKHEAHDLEKIIIINALDLLYFWMYQPRARSVLKDRIRAMS